MYHRIGGTAAKTDATRCLAENKGPRRSLWAANPTDGYGITRPETGSKTYLLVGGGSLENIVHEGREDLGYSEYAGTVRAILGRAGDFLVLLLGQVYPLADYGVDEIQNA